MKKGFVGAIGLCSLFALSSCLTVNAKKTVELPAIIQEQINNETVKVEKEALAYFYYSTDDVPVIDGKFAEWQGLEGVHTRQQVYGGHFNPGNADGFFVTRTDGDNLYVYANVTDNDARENTFEVSQAWRGDGVEFFFGTDTSKHTSFKDSDVRVRIVPRSTTDKSAVGIGINDTEVESEDIQAAIVFGENGYEVETKFPLSLLSNKSLKNNQSLRVDYQVNDADGGKERTGLLHWNSPNDNTYADPSSWGNAKVVSLPE